MKKITLAFALMSLSAAAVSAQSAFLPEFVWGNMFDGDTTAGDQSQAISVSSDGNVYWYNIGGSTESIPEIRYAGEVLFEGAAYNAGNSYNGNLCIIKTDAEGNAIWNLHSLSCDFASNDGSVEATKDGGAIFTARLRHTDGMLDTPLTLVDGTGQSHVFDWKVDRRYYRVIVGRLSADGALVWSRFIECDTTPAPAASGNYVDFTAEALSVPALALDNEENIFIGGNFRNNMHIPTPDGEKVLYPRNISLWSGDPQESAGGMYVVKLDSEGYYVADIPVEGKSQKEVVNRLLWGDGSLYFQALVNGSGDSVSIAGYSFTPEGDFTPVIGCLDSDLNPAWIDVFKGEKLNGKYGFQNCGISVCEDTLWFAGMFNGTVYSPSGDMFFQSSQANMREGFLAKIDAVSGKCERGVSSRASFPDNILTGYLDAIQNPYAPSKVYVYGYGMNAKMGVFLRPYNATTLEADPEDAWTLASQGGVPAAVACDYDMDNEVIYFTARGNKPFDCAGETVGSNSTWAVLMAKYSLPEDNFPTAVSFTPSENEVRFYAEKGSLTIQSDESVSIAIYDIAGRKVASPIVEGSFSISLPSGIYLISGRKILIP